MPNKTIKNVMAGDISSTRTAASLLADFPDLFNAVGDVPPYLYTPLWKLLLPDSTDSAELADAIVDRYGESAPDAEQSIEIISLPVDSIEEVKGMFVDSLGAEFAQVKILTRLHIDVPQSRWDAVAQIDCRIHWLLDQNVRLRRKRYDEPALTPRLPHSDFTLNQNFPILCTWRGYLSTETVIERCSLFFVQYQRIFV